MISKANPKVKLLWPFETQKKIMKSDDGDLFYLEQNTQNRLTE